MARNKRADWNEWDTAAASHLKATRSFFTVTDSCICNRKSGIIHGYCCCFCTQPDAVGPTGMGSTTCITRTFYARLGPQIKAHIERRFSMPWSQPAARMRELVLAIRAIWACWQDGEKLAFTGEFFTHTLMPPLLSPGPNPFGKPKIYLAGVGPAMTEVAGEVGDGFIVHPLNSNVSLETLTLPALAAGREKTGKNSR
jgi:probable F420-dependent oxidoreductase